MQSNPTSKDYAEEAERSRAGRGEERISRRPALMDRKAAKGSKEKDSLHQMPWGEG